MVATGFRDAMLHVIKQLYPKVDMFLKRSRPSEISPSANIAVEMPTGLRLFVSANLLSTVACAPAISQSLKHIALAKEERALLSSSWNMIYFLLYFSQEHHSKP